MAFYKYDAYVSKVDIDVFDESFHPGTRVTYSGIYRCRGCGKEIASNGGDPFPPQNHHQHGALTGPIVWQLIVMRRVD